MAACGSDGPVEEALDDLTSGEDGGGSDEAPAQFTGVADFEPVCRGIALDAAAEYVPDDGTNLTTAFLGEDPDFEPLYGALAEGWEPEFDTETEFEAFAMTELVVCLDRTETIEGELCEGYEDEESGSEWSVMTYGGDYEVKLRAAKTGEVVAETTMSTQPGECPMFSSYSEGEELPIKDYASPDDELQSWLVEYVQAA